MKKHIPNTITLCNLVCGCIAVKYAFADNYMVALAFIVAGAIFDFFDGFMARKLNVSSPIGKELDSLADVITFGFAPAAMIFSLITRYACGYADSEGSPASDCWLGYLSVTGLLVAAFSALRLAKFNLDERQTTSFIGLPTPANALFVASAVITLGNHQDWLAAIGGETVSPNIVGLCIMSAISIACSILLVCELPMFALKFKNFTWRDNSIRYIFLLSSVAILGTMAVFGLPRLIAGIGIVIGWYIIVSIFVAQKSRVK